MEIDDLYNLAALAIRLNLSREWLAAEADAGRLPCLRVGRRRLFSLKAVRAELAIRAAAAKGGAA
ncbi:MAG: hypothetical protein HS116_19205 [Planctomycetes bacterium]|nr:hypothetical protein [Planctomycetota bacterium]